MIVRNFTVAVRMGLNVKNIKQTSKKKGRTTERIYSIKKRKTEEKKADKTSGTNDSP